MFLVKVRTVFSAAHRLYREDLSDDENLLLYGKCSNINGHGHNYDLEVVVAGEINPETGMVINFYDLNNLISEHVYDKVDHRNLNTDVDFMRGYIPTAENMAKRFWEVLEPHLKGGRLFSISIGERNTNVISYFGPSPDMAALHSVESGV